MNSVLLNRTSFDKLYIVDTGSTMRGTATSEDLGANIRTIQYVSKLITIHKL